MSEIKRYEPVEDGIHPYNTGDYVLYTDHNAALEAVKATVKPLEWEEYKGRRDRYDQWEALTLIKPYIIFDVRSRGEGFEWFMIDHGSVNKAGTLEEAKAAAQADYEQRILSALAPSPALEANQQPEPMKLDITREWFEKHAVAEGDIEIGAGSRKTKTLNLTDEELAELEKLANPEAARLRTALEANQQVIETLRDDVVYLQTANHAMNEDHAALKEKFETLRAALEPFSKDIENWTDEHGWTDEAPSRDRICDWFGPTDFRNARALLSALVPSPALEAKETKAAQITMGRGLVDVSRITHEGRSGILFRPRDTFIPVGDDGELQPGSYWPTENDVVIWIENEGGAAVIAKYLAEFLPALEANQQVSK